MATDGGISGGTRTATPHDADDLLQEARLAAWLASHRFDPSAGVKMSSFCWHSARGAMLDWRRREAKAFKVQSDPELLRETAPMEPPRPEHILAKAEAARAIASAMRVLPKQQRGVLVALYFEGGTSRDAADKFGLCPARITQIHQAGLRSLRALIGTSH
jgi:RNA polymerase sigma-70 factor (ECF subfamily)